MGCALVDVSTLVVYLNDLAHLFLFFRQFVDRMGSWFLSCVMGERKGGKRECRFDEVVGFCFRRAGGRILDLFDLDILQFAIVMRLWRFNSWF